LAALADGARSDLPLRDRWTLVRLRVRTQPHAMRLRELGHPGDIALERIEIDDERGRIDVVEGVADVRRDSLHPAPCKSRFNSAMIHGLAVGSTNNLRRACSIPDATYNDARSET